MTALERLRGALASSSTTPDPTLRALYTGMARTALTDAHRELDEAEFVVVAQENELARTARTGQQSAIGAAK